MLLSISSSSLGKDAMQLHVDQKWTYLVREGHSCYCRVGSSGSDFDHSSGSHAAAAVAAGLHSILGFVVGGTVTGRIPVDWERGFRID